jgi:hypothetical protein
LRIEGTAPIIGPDAEEDLQARRDGEQRQPAAVRAPLKTFVGAGAKIEATDDGFHVEATLSGESARDLNRQLLSEMRRTEKKTRIRAEWTSGRVTEKFFDYVHKGTKP